MTEALITEAVRDYLTRGGKGVPSPEILDRPGWTLYQCQHGDVLTTEVLDESMVWHAGESSPYDIPKPKTEHIRPVLTVTLGRHQKFRVGIWERERRIVLFKAQ